MHKFEAYTLIYWLIDRLNEPIYILMQQIFGVYWIKINNLKIICNKQLRSNNENKQLTLMAAKIATIIRRTVKEPMNLIS